MKKCLPLLLAAPLLIGAGGTSSLEITVTGIANTRGALLACIWTEKSGFPTCQKSKTAIRQTVKISGSTMKVRFSNLAPGTYAASVHHDADGDGKLKTNFIGMPKEGVGISNNPGGMPGWSKSLVKVNGAGAISITMRYL
ncbi:MAG: hypothetical protein RLZZ58_503 [Pseudomonadota bacterium]|jgi:uncharacterized protein (DUF2141 family)